MVYTFGPESRYMGTALGPKYIPYTYTDPLGKGCNTKDTLGTKSGAVAGNEMTTWESVTWDSGV